jgi:hypothetical protein
MTKFSVSINGSTYELPLKAIRTKTYGPNKGSKYVYVNPPVAGLLVKQFVKRNFPNVLCRVVSDSFSGGNSLRVYVSTKLGAPIDSQSFKTISDFVDMWEYGKFNGMIDMYESYENSGTISDNGLELEAGVKYAFTENQPRFGTVEWVVNEVRSGRTFNDTVKYVDAKIAEKAKVELLPYMSGITA